VRTHLASLVEDFRHHADEPAVVEHRGIRRYRTTYGELAELAGRFAAELDRRGIAPQERVVLWGANSAAWISAFFGCLLRGVIAVPLDAAGSKDFAGRVILDVAPRLIVGDRSLLASLSVPSEVPKMLLSELDVELPTQPNYLVSEAVREQAAFQIVFTSGTTSEPKGIVHTHGNVLASVLPIEREMAKFRKYERFVHPLRFLHTLPLSHVFGQFMGLWLPPLLAGEVHFVEQVEARRITELIRRERISVLVAVPRVVQLLRTHLLRRFDWLAGELERTDLPKRLRRWWHFRKVHDELGWKFWAVISGGAAVPEEMEVFWSRLGIGLIQGYGMTETSALVTLNYPFRISQGTIGKTLPGREVRLSEDGEILVRGDVIASSTWVHGAMHAREGEWLATGDLGERNEAGELRFLGRKGDMIVTAGGLNVHPDDLEAAMKKQPGIRDCAVVPCQTVAGMEPVAVVVTSLSEEELQAAVREANNGLAEFQQIRRLLEWPTPQFPYTSSGKLLRRKVAEWVCDAVEERQQQSRTTGSRGNSAKSTTEILLEQIAEVTGEPAGFEKAGGDGNQLRLNEDLHLDSLGRVQLQTALEQLFDVELEDDALATVQTLGELEAIVGRESVPRARVRNQSQVAPPVDGSGDLGEPAAELESDKKEGLGGFDAGEDSIANRNSLSSEHLYPYWPWRWPFAALRSAYLELVAQPLTWLLAAPRVVLPEGGLPPGPLLVIANHVTAYDGALILYSLPGRLRRRMAIAMSGEMLLDYRRGRNLGNWFFNLVAPPQYWLVTWLYNVFPLPRLHGFRRSFQHAGEAMDRGYSVMVFPEGARNFEGMQTFRQGIGLLAMEARVPIVPVALMGLEEMHTSGWFRSKLLEIRIGEAIPVDDSMEAAELTARLEAAVRELRA
jgi:long-chain acyl-CoA synthetase